LAVRRLTKLPISIATPNYQEDEKTPIIIIRPDKELFINATSPIPLRIESMTRIIKC
jgi:hypothetical protein